jgi:hypothetical protein
LCSLPRRTKSTIDVVFLNIKKCVQHCAACPTIIGYGCICYGVPGFCFQLMVLVLVLLLILLILLQLLLASKKVLQEFVLPRDEFLLLL